MISPGDTHKKCRSRQSNQIRDLFYLSSSFSSVHLCCSKSLTVLCVCAPKLLLPVSIIQFSSAARINQSSLRCLLFANNFSWLLSNSSELSYWRWNFYCILSFLFIFAYNFAVDAGAATAATPASIRIMLISVSSFKIIQINCGIYLGSFFFHPARTLSLSPHAGTHKELNSRARLTKNDQNINTLMHIPRALFGLDHLLLLLLLF